MSLSHENKLRFAQLVKENKSILFGRHSPTLTNHDKFAKWKSIYDELVSHGAVIKDVVHLRNTMWGNLKRSTIIKRNANAKTGAAGGKRYTEVDHVVLDILDQNSAYLAGLGQNDEPPLFGSGDGLGHAAGRGSDASLLDVTSESNFNLGMTFATRGPSFPTPGPSFVTPHPPASRLPLQQPAARSSTPVDLETEEAGIQAAVALKKRKRGPPTSLWTEDAYKALKLKKIQKDMEEQELRMDLMRGQIEEARQRAEAEKQRAAFFMKAGLAFDSNHVFQIRSLDQGANEYNFKM